MAGIRTQIENRLPARIGRMNRATVVGVRRALHHEGQVMRAELIDELDQQGRNVSRTLGKSITYRADVTARGGLLSVGPGTEYAASVEFGSKPHWAPIGPLIAWVHDRRLAGRYGLKTRKRLGKRRSQFYEDWDVASRIQFKIARKGTQAHPFVGPVFERESKRSPQRFERTLLESLQEADR